MRRMMPQAALALPPIDGTEVASDGAGWTTTERIKQHGKINKSLVKKISAKRNGANIGFLSDSPRGRVADGSGVTSGKSRHHSVSPPRRAETISSGEGLADSGGGASHSGSVMSARGVAGERLAQLASAFQVDIQSNLNAGQAVGAADGPKQNAMKHRAIENWLNHTLGQANNKPAEALGEGVSVASTTAKQTQGLSQFGVDAAALEKLGLDTQSAERVYRAMFVYSQGLHAVLQEAVGRSKDASQALLVLWRAFTAVLEHAGQSEQHGAESLAALVQRGNEEEKARIENLYREQLTSLQSQTQKLLVERRGLQDDLQRVREDEVRLWNESEMYRSEHLVAVSKYEREIKQRVDAEVRFLEKTRWADVLQEDLNKERKQCMQIQALLSEANAAKEAARVELDSLRMQVKTLEAQAGAFKQNALEAAQQRQRHEQQVAQYKQSIDRMTQKIHELKEQLEQEVDLTKKLTEQTSNHQREMRKLETQYEDEAHARKELQNERDHMRDKIDRFDRELVQLTEERRAMQKEINDLSMTHRTNQIELKRKVDQLGRTEKQHERLQISHRELLDTHRSLVVEAEHLRDDVTHLDDQLKKESDLRKQLQAEKKQLTGQLQTILVERDTQILAVQGTQKELREVTEKLVKMESIVRDTKFAMQKLTLEHQVELKANAQKVAMLEKVVADERKERRNLVAESQEVMEKREEALDKLKTKTLEVQEVKRQRLEKEEEVDRLKVLLKAQEQRNAEQLVTVDQYQATVASHDAETRQMQVLLECERVEAKRQLREMQDAHAAARHTMDRRVEQWKMCFEDVNSRLHFNPATEKLHLLGNEVIVLRQELELARATIETNHERLRTAEDEVTQRGIQAEELGALVEKLSEEKTYWLDLCTQARQDYEFQAMACNDAEQCCVRIRQNNMAFDEMRAAFEAQIESARQEIARLVGLFNTPCAEAATQTNTEISEKRVQTDLSYQYLEGSERLQQDRWRRERLDILKKASHFVEDPEQHRDFVVNSTPLAGAAILQDVELRLDVGQSSVGGASTVIAPSVSRVPVHGASPRTVSRDASGRSNRKGDSSARLAAQVQAAHTNRATSAPRVPDPWPAAREPPGRPPMSAQAAQAVRA
eukprot:TRINITY_DN37664_c0_g1_i1.p1 TRINITY_DN37664_c0_g1~~TRINITY_DN37664_c0_g1_i1.p1  ORF type:complete len:1117 (+),score=251.02 TRINITY_DN37664_c0_g1_i1:330-3680(+)